MQPFSEREFQQVRHLGEHGLIRAIATWLGPVNPAPPEGIGDDAAVLPQGAGNLVVTNDSVVLNKHFNPSTPPGLVGEKLLKRNISDLAAMGATPRYAVLACFLPPQTAISWLEAFYRGLRDAATRYAIALVGGDTASSFQDLAFTLTLLGTSAEKPLTRKSGKPGDTVWVTGSLGGSLLGKHLHFAPRLEEGRWLADHPGITSGMDVSDGLATDLLNLRPVSSTLEIDTDAIPVSESARETAGKNRRSALAHALQDGEDYELLFTLDAAVNPVEFLLEWKEVFQTPLTCIGKVVSRKGTEMEEVVYRGSFRHFKGKGYEHF